MKIQTDILRNCTVDDPPIYELLLEEARQLGRKSDIRTPTAITWYDHTLCEQRRAIVVQRDPMDCDCYTLRWPGQTNTFEMTCVQIHKLGGEFEYEE